MKGSFWKVPIGSPQGEVCIALGASVFRPVFKVIFDLKKDIL